MSHSSTTAIPRSLRTFQIIVGAICIILSVLVLVGPRLGTYTFLFFIEITLLILGAERIASGVRSPGIKKSSRIINIAIGSAMIGFALLGFFTPKLTTQWLVLLLGLGLLANGIVRIVDGFRNKDIYESSAVISRLGAGIVSAAVAILVLVFPIFGFILILIILSIALLITGIELIIVGIRGRRIRTRFL
ncbi:MAG TPA: DUF308 domain-containing protein [Nitrososphaeraceae archaeon]|jgi:uncharacterized membrane protein HdeD (DUF308 family)|nr:DUF308 domain-containing protein [Nitrososphaeraceae archaeon]